MTKVTFQSEIDKFELTGATIEVHFSNPEDVENSTYNVDRQAFDTWLKQSGKLDWEMYYQDREYNGSMTAQDYWDEAENRYKLEDLKEFMVMLEKRLMQSQIKSQTEVLRSTVAAVTNEGFANQVLANINTLIQNERDLLMLNIKPMDNHVLQLMSQTLSF